MARKKAKKPTDSSVASEYRHEDAKRKNNPPAGLAAHGTAKPAPKIRYAYDPHLPPALRFNATGRAQYLNELINRAVGGMLSEENAELLRELLGSGEPWLEWAGKREAHEFVVDPVALHIHERVSARAIIAALRRGDVQRDLFADPQQEYREAVRFYEHDVDWSNRMILGDSLQVMASLAHRENLAGKVRMIYMDPPYGIRFASNFQPEIGRRDVKDREQDLTREPEMVKAYRDTWTLGVHSYLSYLRDRLILARELLTDSGSIFVQIWDENLHRVRLVMDEVFGAENFQVTIAFRRLGMMVGETMKSGVHYLLWFAKDSTKLKYRKLFLKQIAGVGSGDHYTQVQARATGFIRPMSADERSSPQTLTDDQAALQLISLATGGYRPNTTINYSFQGHVYHPGSNKCWRTTREGLDRLATSERIRRAGNTIRYAQYLDDFALTDLTSSWDDTARDPENIYVVQTPSKVIERCMLMTTDPGDLVLDPTCGSGTTAYVAEQWGRRWITMDTSRVALALARQRLMTGTYPHYSVKGDNASDGKADPKRGFRYKTVPHITLKSIAQNVGLDPIFEKHGKILAERLGRLNEALADVSAETRTKLKRKLAEKEKAEGKRAVTNADRRRWLLPEKAWQEWEVPFDTDEDWPAELQKALVVYREAWRAKMDEVNAMIAAGADQEELVDQPEVEKGVVRVSGPFTMEAVMPAEASDADGEPGFAGLPVEEFDVFAASDADNVEAFVDRMLRLLVADGVRFPDNRTMKLTRLDRIEAGHALHGEGEWENGDGGVRHVVVSIGPEHGPVTAYQVEEALREANRRGADEIVFAGFAFEGAAQAAIQEDPHPRVRAHMAHIAPDVQMGGLLKATPNSQIFSVFGLPQAELVTVGDGEWVVDMQGVDIYDPVTNTIHPTRADKVAAWFLDSDYDGRTFCITQAFFPDRSAWTKLERALKGTIDPERFSELTGTRSLPFRRGKFGRVAVKVIDPRGNDVMKVIRLP